MSVGRGGGGHGMCLMFNDCGRVLVPPRIKSISNLLPWRKKLLDWGNMISITCGYAVVNFETVFK